MGIIHVPRGIDTKRGYAPADIARSAAESEAPWAWRGLELAWLGTNALRSPLDVRDVQNVRNTLGTAARLDGSTNQLVGNAGALSNLSLPLTLFAIFKPLSFSGEPSEVVVNTSDPSGSYFYSGVGITYASDRLVIQTGKASGTSSEGRYNWQWLNTISSRFYYVVAVVESVTPSGATLYVDGESKTLSQSGTASTIVFPSDTPPVAGKWTLNGIADRFSNLDFGLFGVADRAWSEAEAKQWTEDPFAPFRRRHILIPVSSGGGAASVSPAGFSFPVSLAQPALTQAHVLPPNDAAHSQALASPGLSAGVSLAGNDVLLAPETAQPTLTQAYVLSVSGTSNTTGTESAGLTQAHALPAGSLQVGTTLDPVSLTEAAVLAVAGLDHAVAGAQPALTQAHALTADDLTHSLGLEASNLGVAGVLSAADLMAGATLDAPALTQAHVLAVQGASSATSVEASGVSTSVVLAPASSDAGTAVGTPTLSAAAMLEARDLLHSLVTEDSAALTDAVIVASDALFSLLVESASFGGPVRHHGRLLVVEASDRLLIVAASERLVIN